MKEINTPVLVFLNAILALGLLALIWTPMVFVYAAYVAVPVMFAILLKIVTLPAIPLTDLQTESKVTD
ncbi:hypothetical protein [Luteithermobacter gelatinilyticus]|uniref:hypothetical protein n=1 Tax=Luteithermobacter gelatinilyticus TaxID=2582913 RepID=UPI0011062683|nr:hypothetical protein [Luteithermobacter gelatinilyticus]|tara:strand:- start:16729 stop:16932 length:204 start_codon:yes stop_codon:yes gene_type:complete